MGRLKPLIFVIIVAVLAAMVIGCAAPSPTPTQIPTPTPTPTPTPSPTPEPTPPPAPPAEPEEPAITAPAQISWEEAKDYIGETRTVCGQVITVFIRLTNDVIMNLGDVPSEGGCIVLITDSTMFPEGLLESLYLKTVCVTGEIKESESGYPGIFVTDPSQIEIK